MKLILVCLPTRVENGILILGRLVKRVKDDASKFWVHLRRRLSCLLKKVNVRIANANPLIFFRWFLLKIFHGVIRQ